MKSKCITTYYIVLSGLLLVKVIATIFQGSLVLLQNHQLAQLEQQRHSLEQQELQLSQQLAATQSLSQISQLPLVDQFQPMTTSLTLTTTTAVAANNL